MKPNQGGPIRQYLTVKILVARISRHCTVSVEVVKVGSKNCPVLWIYALMPITQISTKGRKYPEPYFIGCKFKTSIGLGIRPQLPLSFVAPSAGLFTCGGARRRSTGGQCCCCCCCTPYQLSNPRSAHRYLTTV